MIGDETHSNHDTKEKLALDISPPSTAPTHPLWWLHTEPSTPGIFRHANLRGQYVETYVKNDG